MNTFVHEGISFHFNSLSGEVEIREGEEFLGETPRASILAFADYVRRGARGGEGQRLAEAAANVSATAQDALRRSPLVQEWMRKAGWEAQWALETSRD